MAYLLAFLEIEAKIADLGFSSKRYFFPYFVLKKIDFEKSYGDFIFYAGELRCADYFLKIENFRKIRTGFCETNQSCSNSVLDRNSAQTDVTYLVLLKLLEKGSFSSKNNNYIDTFSLPTLGNTNGWFVRSARELGSLVFRTRIGHELDLMQHFCFKESVDNVRRSHSTHSALYWREGTVGSFIQDLVHRRRHLVHLSKNIRSIPM